MPGAVASSRGGGSYNMNMGGGGVGKSYMGGGGSGGVTTDMINAIRSGAGAASGGFGLDTNPLGASLLDANKKKWDEIAGGVAVSNVKAPLQQQRQLGQQPQGSGSSNSQQSNINTIYTNTVQQLQSLQQQQLVLQHRLSLLQPLVETFEHPTTTNKYKLNVGLLLALLIIIVLILKMNFV